ncbi:MAG: hypothetical protein IPL54_17365 [Chitinophagaceae bacterium]|nr:hypothetical protein [Chitinophagaceae bacterium]
MKKNRKIYSVYQLSSAMLMIVLLCWLTISTPFVYASQQDQAKHGKVTHACVTNCGSEDETSNPFGNNTEEKAPNSSSLSEEYLHSYQATPNFYIEISLYHKCENADTYIAYHGELLGSSTQCAIVVFSFFINDAVVRHPPY